MMNWDRSLQQSELRPALLDDLGLIAAIEWQLKDFQSRTDIECSVSFNNGNIKVPENSSIALFRICQETLTNVARHSKATNVKVSMYNEDNNVILRTRDNGIGIEESQISNSKSFGLIGIRERALALGGDVKIMGREKMGTTLTVSIPLNGMGIEL